MNMVPNKDFSFRLISAVQEGRLRNVKQLIQSVSKSSINSITDKDGVTVLSIAADKGYFRIADYLLTCGACVNSAALKDGFTSLHFSVNRNFKGIVKMLLNYGANVNAKGKDGTTPLHIACDKGYFQMANLLLKHGADPNSMNTSHHGKNSIITPGCTPLHLAVKRGNKKIVQLLLDNGAVMNTVGKDSNGIPLEANALHFACQVGDIEIVEVLVRSGAAVNFKDSNNSTALHIAIKHSSVNIIPFLLESAADIEAKDACGRTALHIAAMVGNSFVVKLLISYKADIEARDECGRTPLHIASQYSHVQAAKTLLNYGSDINSVSLYNYTPLHVAMLPVHASSYNIFNGVSSRVVHFGKLKRICQKMFVRFMTEYIVKRKIAHLYVCELNLKLINIDDVKLIKFRRYCVEEMERLKSKNITHNVSLHDILTKSMNQLAVYAGNKDVYQFLQSSDFEESFPMYASLIDTNFRMGVERRELLEICHQLFYAARKLTSVCTEKILSYLSNRDIKILIDAFKYGDIHIIKDQHTSQER